MNGFCIKRRWRRYSGIKDKIFLIIKSNQYVTTAGVVVILKDQEINVTWKLVNSFLMELEFENKVNRFKIGDKHKINLWNIC